MLSVIAGASLLALAGAANASEPITLTSAQLDGVTAGGIFTHYQNIFVANTSLSYVNLTGNAAIAEAGADAYGNNTLTKTLTGTVTTSYSSSSGSFSSSSTD
jgi:hypothetical protein